MSMHVNDIIAGAEDHYDGIVQNDEMCNLIAKSRQNLYEAILHVLKSSDTSEKENLTEKVLELMDSTNDLEVFLILAISTEICQFNFPPEWWELLKQELTPDAFEQLQRVRCKQKILFGKSKK